MEQPILDTKLMDELFHNKTGIVNNSMEEEKQNMPVKEKSTLDMTLLMDNFKTLIKQESQEAQEISEFSSYRHCDFNTFVMWVSTHFPIDPKYCDNPSWFTLEQSVEFMRSARYKNTKYDVTEEEAKKYLDSLVSQGFYEVHEGKYHRIMYCSHHFSGTYFFPQSGVESKLAMVDRGVN